MDIRLAVAVFGVLLSQVHGHPRSAGESGVATSEDSKMIIPLGVSGTKEVQTATVVEKEKSPGKLKSPVTSLGAKLKSRLVEDLKLPTTSKETQDEAVRSARQSPQPPFHQMSFGKGPHMTTVCIQVHSNHQPQVICGPQYGDRDEPSAPPAAARFASPYEYARAAPPGYAQGPPAPARGFPTRRTEEDLKPRPMDPNVQPAPGFGPQAAQGPPRDIPLAPPSPVNVHRNYYQPIYSAGLMSPAQALMRLNCAIEPSGQIVSPQVVRGGALGYSDQPMGDLVFTLPDGSPAKFGANIVSPAPIRPQNSYATMPQWAARSAAEEDMAYLNSQMPGSAQSYPSRAWNYGAYPGESYPTEMMGRSASGEDSSRNYLGYPAEYSGLAPAVDSNYARREFLQLEALRESNEKLRDLQDQLANFKEQELQKLSSKNSSSSETTKDPSAAGVSIDIKATKANKRHTRT